MRLTRRGRAVAYTALLSAAFATGFLLPPPNYAPCAACTTHIERHR